MALNHHSLTHSHGHHRGPASNLWPEMLSMECIVRKEIPGSSQSSTSSPSLLDHYELNTLHDEVFLYIPFKNKVCEN